MASVFAGMYVKMIKIGKRTIDDVRPDELKDEVIDLLVAEGRDDLAGIEKEEVKEETPIDNKEDEAPTDSTEEKEEPIKDDEPKEDKEG